MANNKTNRLCRVSGGGRWGHYGGASGTNTANGQWRSSGDQECTVFLMALLMWARAHRHIRKVGVPDGRVVYQDTDRRRNVERALVSPSCGLTGKPDYLVEAPVGLIPVELKSRNCPGSGPHEGEAAQVTAYCVLVEDSFGATPSRDYSVR